MGEGGLPRREVEHDDACGRGVALVAALLGGTLATATAKIEGTCLATSTKFA